MSSADSKDDSHVVEIDDTNFEKLALRAPVPVLVDFTAAWCGPCRVITPHVEAIATAYDGRVRVGKCDVDDNQTSAMKFDIRSLPTLLMFRDGKVVAQMVGPATRSKIEAWVTSALG